MKPRIVAALAACVLCACENPEGQADRFIAEAGKRAEDARGKVPPLPDYQPRKVVPLVIERDPFKR